MSAYEAHYKKEFNELCCEFYNFIASLNPDFSGYIYLEDGSRLHLESQRHFLVGAMAYRVNQLLENGDEISTIAEVVQVELVAFATGDFIDVKIYGPIENLYGDTADLELNGLAVKRFKGGEMFHAVNSLDNGFRNNLSGFIWEYFYIIPYRMRYSLVNPPPEPTCSDQKIKPVIDRLEICLAIFGNGPVSINQRHFSCAKFFPNIWGSTSKLGPQHFGTYTFIPEARENFVSVFNNPESPDLKKLLFAAKRLSHAENRFDFLDSVVDAVIGMESILLASEDDRGELRYRFSLNFSTFYSGTESRLAAFRLARSLYDMRSHIVHGAESKLDQKLFGKINADDKTPLGCAIIAKKALRELIYKILFNQKFDIKDSHAWNSRVVG